MKLKSAVLVNALSAEFKTLGIKQSVQVPQYKLEAESGHFMLFARFNDSVSLRDTMGASDLLTFVLDTAREDTAEAFDWVVKDVSKGFADQTGATEEFELVLDKRPYEQAGASERYSFHMERALADTAAVVGDEVHVTNNKPFTDSASPTDMMFVEVGKEYSEQVATGDAYCHEFHKFPGDEAGASDVARTRIDKALADTAYATDDMDGTASVLDDQTISTTKVRSERAVVSDTIHRVVRYVRQFGETVRVSDEINRRELEDLSDTTGVSDRISLGARKVLAEVGRVRDTLTLLLTKGFSDGAAVRDAHDKRVGKAREDRVTCTDSGEITLQNYCDPSYFAEDYVGTKINF